MWWILIAVVVGVLLLSLKRHFGHDEFEGVHTGWKILQGERIYLDFFQHHHPFYYYVTAFVISLAGETVAAVLTLRLISFAAYAAMLLLTWRLAMQIYKRRMVAKIALILLSSAYIFFDSAIEIRPDVPQVFFGFAAFVLLTAMAVTSTNGMRRRLGKRWQNIHNGVYVVGLLVVWHYWWQVKKDITEPLIYAAILALLLGYRIWWKRRH